MKEIDQKTTFEQWLQQADETLPAVAIRSLNIDPYKAQLLQKKLIDSLFLGCQLCDEVAGHIVKTGGTVIPNGDEVLFKTHLARLYSADDLFEGFSVEHKEGYHCTLDYKIYEEYVRQGKDYPAAIHISLMRRLHDHSITEALMDEIEGRKVVAIMGGHGMERSEPFYFNIAKIARALTQKGFLLVSGGGPGAMEATHLGAYFATRSLAELEQAIDCIKVRPEGAPEGKEYEDWDWLHRAWKVRAAFPIPKGDEAACKSIGIPTWLYGHEPPAIFATHIAKYFANSVREEGLLAIAKHGVIFAPGSAGTTQEIFQDACQNHYYAYNEDKNIPRYVSPMILFGQRHWTSVRPVWELLQKVAKDHPYGDLLALSDDADSIIQQIEDYDPTAYTFPQL